MNKWGIWIGLVMAGCGTAPGDSDTAAGDAPTYYRDIQPILAENCIRCHSEGGVAPVSFEDPDVVVATAALIKAYTESGVMPPPAPDPACADYHDSEKLSLTEEKKAIIAAWVDADAPLGDPEDAPEVDDTSTDLDPFDIELVGAMAYTPDFSDDGKNDYRCFDVTPSLEDGVYVTGFGAILDNTPFVHHVVVYTTENEPETPPPEEGFPCNGTGEGGWDYLAGWAPGASPTRFDEGEGIFLGPEKRLILQMHYFNSGATGTDQSGMGFWTAPQVSGAIYPYPLGIGGFTIEAGNSAHTETESLDWESEYPDIAVVGVWPHMHVLGSHINVRVVHEDDTETCVMNQDGWDFHNQVPVLLKEPITVTAGDRVDLTCEWDNSADNPNQFNDPPEDVQFGEGTENEMCFAFTYVRLD